MKCEHGNEVIAEVRWYSREFAEDGLVMSKADGSYGNSL